MAAQDAGAFKPTPVTMPVPVIAIGKPLMLSSHLAEAVNGSALQLSVIIKLSL